MGVHCPLDIIMERRNADPQAGFYATGETPPPVLRWQAAVHVPGIYDLSVDTARQPGAMRRQIAEALAQPPSPAPSSNWPCVGQRRPDRRNPSVYSPKVTCPSASIAQDGFQAISQA